MNSNIYIANIDVYSQLYQLYVYKDYLLIAIGAGSLDNSNFKFLENKIEKSGIKANMVLKRNVPHQELIQLYMRAELLIVPMRNIVQDIAGFHHKVGEYTAAGKPIISNNIGELKHYFQDGVSAILADEYSIESYVAKLSVSLSSKDKLNNIAENGHQVGLKYLNYRNYSIELKNFLQTI